MVEDELEEIEEEKNDENKENEAIEDEKEENSIEDNIAEPTPQTQTNLDTNEDKVNTVASLLNLDLNALKNSGATITITIKFDKE